MRELELTCVAALLLGLYLAFGLAAPLIAGGVLGVVACEWSSAHPRARDAEDVRR